MTRPSVTGARLSYLPVGKQHAGAGLRFGMALVGHAEIGPAHAVPAGDEAAERLRVSGLAADRHAADPGARRGGLGGGDARVEGADRKSTRLNSSHGYISYAVFCLKK